MNKIILFTALLFAGSFLAAQSPAFTTSVFFETDKSELSAEAKQTLDALAPSLLSSPDYQVNIEAFTDDRGTQEYNLSLAADRAAAVQNYLGTKGLISSKTTVKNWGKEKANDPSDVGRQKNRRVDLSVNAFYFQDLYSLQDRLSANTDQVIQIQPNQEQKITGSKGTLLIVPANAFVFEDGSAPTSTVDIIVREAFNPSDFIMHDLTTMSDERILQTGGMVYIDARSEGKALHLAEGASLTVSIPDKGNFDPKMELFYAQTTANNRINWQPAGQSFRRTLKPNRVELKIDPALGKRIASIKVPEWSQPALPVFKGELPPEPKLSAAPYKPHAPRKPDWETAQRMFGGGTAETNRMSRKEIKKAQSYFNQQMELYVRDSAKYVLLAERYQQNLKKYEDAKVRYAKEHLQWTNELKSRLQAIMLYQREMQVMFYSKGLAKALKTKAKSIHEYDTYSNLYWAVDQAADDQTQFLMTVNGLLDLKAKAKGEPRLGQKLFENLIGTKVIDTYGDYNKVSWEVSNALPPDTTQRVKDRIIAATGIKKISDSLIAEIKEKTILTSSSPEQVNAALQGYVASVSQLGWINCDRFYNDPAEKMQVVVDEPEDVTLYAVCKDIKAMLSFNRNETGKYVAKGLPKGHAITIVAIKIKDGMPQFAQSNMKVGDAPLAKMAFRSMPLRDLREELQKLNI